MRERSFAVSGWKLWGIAIPILLIAALAAAWLYHRSHQPRQLTAKDSIVIGDFANSTGDAVFDDTSFGNEQRRLKPDSGCFGGPPLSNEPLRSSIA